MRHFLKVARLQREFCTKDFFRATNFLTKNAPKFSPKFLSLCSVGQKKPGKFPPNFPLNFPNSLRKIKNKFTDELLQERRENIFVVLKKRLRGSKGQMVSTAPRHHTLENVQPGALGVIAAGPRFQMDHLMFRFSSCLGTSLAHKSGGTFAPRTRVTLQRGMAPRTSQKF